MNPPVLKVCYADIPNMGDQLNPLILSRFFGYRITPSSPDEAELFALGSRLRMLAERKSKAPVSVWGMGFISKDDADPPTGLDVTFRAVRGELTKRRVERALGVKLDVQMADPGLLSSRLLEGPVEKEYDLGVIAHYREQDDPRFVRLTKLAERTLVIDVMQHPLVVIRQIASCRRILSSSLHGLIISDSLGIPNLHIRVTDKLAGDGFKFDDYYSSFGVPHTCVDLNRETVESLEVIDRLHRISPEAVAEKQRQLLESFPFPKADPSALRGVSALSLFVPRGILRHWASRRFGVVFGDSGRRQTKSALKRVSRYLMPFGVVALRRTRKFREPLAEILGDAFFRVLNWRW